MPLVYVAHSISEDKKVLTDVLTDDHELIEELEVPDFFTPEEYIEFLLEEVYLGDMCECSRRY